MLKGRKSAGGHRFLLSDERKKKKMTSRNGLQEVGEKRLDTEEKNSKKTIQSRVVNYRETLLERSACSPGAPRSPGALGGSFVAKAETLPAEKGTPKRRTSLRQKDTESEGPVGGDTRCRGGGEINQSQAP